MADILIKGMDMPIEGEAVALVLSKENGIMMAEVDEYCGAVYEAVPISPHGRLIDADELRAAMYHEAFEKDSDMQRWDSGCWIRYKMFEKAIETAPTVIEASEDGEQDGKL